MPTASASWLSFEQPLGEKAPEILNADNGRRRDGAVFDYSPALREFKALAPGQITGAIPWRFKFAEPLQPPLLYVIVRAASVTQPRAEK